jgi:hypothetical protein
MIMHTQLSLALNWLENALSDLLRIGRERRFTIKTGVAMLKLLRQFEGCTPEMSRREIYVKVVIAHVGCSQAEATVLLKSATSSYATWPTQRELTFCDVVHYISFSEFAKIDNQQNWTQSDLTPVVASIIPKNFCIHRPSR